MIRLYMVTSSFSTSAANVQHSVGVTKFKKYLLLCRETVCFADIVKHFKSKVHKFLQPITKTFLKVLFITKIKELNCDLRKK